jgi:AcrR family transcriptional regulator
MGRPRQHGDELRAKLVARAESMIADGGVGGISIRRLAEAERTTTRAIYSLFEGRGGVLSALYREAFRALSRRLDRVPLRADPVEDLRHVATAVFRGFALEHPSLYRLAFERSAPGFQPDREDRAVALETVERLRVRVERLAAAGKLGGRSSLQVTRQFHALCQGLASGELHLWGEGAVISPEAGTGEAVWRDAVGALLRGYDDSPARPSRDTRRRP